MTTEQAPIQVRYWPKDGAVSLGGDLQIDSSRPQQPQHPGQAGQCSSRTILKIALPIIALLFLAVPAITVCLVRNVERSSNYRQENTELPDVANLKVTDVGPTHFTISWTPPLAYFDYYWVESYDVGNSRDAPAPLRVGSCSNGTIIHRGQSQTTCDKLKACANLSVTVHTKIERGIDDATSAGVKLESILIPGKEPDSPKNIRTVQASPSVIRIQWEAPSNVSGRIVGHSVLVCRTFTSCNEPESVSNCTERDTSDTWVDLQYSGNSKLCVLVTSSAECGAQVLRSRPASAEITPPSFELPDVATLRVTDVGPNHFTISWTPPLAYFDYYWVESYDVGNSRDTPAPLRVGSCSNGTIIHRGQSQTTCDKLKACANVSITVHTKIERGTDDATSAGVKLGSILIPGKEPDSPKNITTVQASPTVTRVQWEAPSNVSGRIVGHSVLVCRTFTTCNEPESVSNCTERDTSDTWVDLQYSGNSKLCVLVTSSAECGAQVLRSRPASAEITPTSFVLPDVVNFTLVDLGPDHLTVSWVAPVAQFDYYWLEVYQGSEGSDTRIFHHVGSCANGTIVHRDQTQITCNMFKPCSYVTITLYTLAKGTTELRSNGATLQGIFMAAIDIPEVVNLTLRETTKSSITVSWQKPNGCFEDYVVQAIQDKTELSYGQNLSAGSCGNQRAVDATQTNVTCDNIQACSVDVTVQTRRKRPLELTSDGVTVTLQRLRTDLPEPHYTLQQLGSSLYVFWVPPSGCGPKYNLTISFNTDLCTDSEEVSSGSCAGTTILDSRQTNLACTNIPSCGYTNVTLTPQRYGDRASASVGRTIAVILSKGHLTETSAIMKIYVPFKDRCEDSDCGATVEGPDYSKDVSCYSNADGGCSLFIGDLRSRTKYTCSTWIENPWTRVRHSNQIDFVTP